jgi:hypothetical protein
MPKPNANLADAASLIFKAKDFIHGPFKGMTDEIIEQDIKLPLVLLHDRSGIGKLFWTSTRVEVEMENQCRSLRKTSKNCSTNGGHPEHHATCLGESSGDPLGAQRHSRYGAAATGQEDD